MIDFYKSKNIQIFTLEYDGLEIINKSDNKYVFNKTFSICYIFENRNKNEIRN